jgi:hypothetical protein
MLQGAVGPNTKPAPTFAGARDYLVIETEPTAWALAASYVQTVLLASAWIDSVLNLDLLLGLSPTTRSTERVIVLRTNAGNCALSTRSPLRLRTFESIDHVAIPALVFDPRFGGATTKQLLLADNELAFLVFDVEVLSDLAGRQGLTTIGLSTPGDPLL